MAMKAMKAMKKSAQVKKCQNFRKCRRNAKSSRAKFCLSCFQENAAIKAPSGSGLSQGSPVNAGNSHGKGNPSNAGNSQGKGNLGNAGNSQGEGNLGNAGNSQGKGNLGNTGNTILGRRKKSAGRRSGVKRCAKVALVVQKPWLDKILAGEQDLGR